MALDAVNDVNFLKGIIKLAISAKTGWSDREANVFTDNKKNTNGGTRIRRGKSRAVKHSKQQCRLTPVQPSAVKLVLWCHWMHVTQVHQRCQRTNFTAPDCTFTAYFSLSPEWNSHRLIIVPDRHQCPMYNCLISNAILCVRLGPSWLSSTFAVTALGVTFAQKLWWGRKGGTSGC